jgi:Holliday junction resolvase RusA-like endonuclease
MKGRNGFGLMQYWKRATVKCRFFFRTKARRDGDNIAASCKAYWDGFTDAGLWVDDCGVTHLPPEILHDAKNPRVEIEVTETL